jgi:type I restriction enzyme M protein
MPRPKSKHDTAATLGFEAKLWQATDALRNNMDAAEYKHVVLGLVFLKYISDTFEEQHAMLETERAQGADPEDPDEYRAVHIFWVPTSRPTTCAPTRLSTIATGGVNS